MMMFYGTANLLRKEFRQPCRGSEFTSLLFQILVSKMGPVPIPSLSLAFLGKVSKGLASLSPLPGERLSPKRERPQCQ